MSITYRADTLEMLRRMAYFAEHDPRPQSKCGDCDHCHESDFHCASDDPTLLSREQLRLIYELLPGGGK